MKTIASTQQDLPDLAEIQRFWKRNGLKTGSIGGYSRWVDLFYAEYQSQPKGPVAQLTVQGVQGFAKRYARQHRTDMANTCLAAHSALRAWSEALSCLGVDVPPWQETCPSPDRLNPVLEEYLKDRRSHFGDNVSRERRDLASRSGVSHAARSFARRIKRPLRRTTVSVVEDIRGGGGVFVRVTTAV